MQTLKRSLRLIITTAIAASAAGAIAAAAILSRAENPDWGVIVLFALYAAPVGAAAGAIFIALRWIWSDD